MAKKETKASQAAAAKDAKKQPSTKKETKDIQEEAKDQNVGQNNNAGDTISPSAGKDTSEEKKSLKSTEIESTENPAGKDEEKEVAEENKKQHDAIAKLKAVAYNRHRGTSFQKLKNKISLEDLQSRKNLPLDADSTAEFILDNGDVFSLERGLTSENKKNLIKHVK